LSQKYLTLLLFTLISGNVINFSLQNFNFNHLLAAEDNSQPPEDNNQPVEEERNEPPKADDQKVSVDANDNVKINLEGNDDDKGDEIKFDVVADPSHGTLDNFDESDGTVTYVPEKDYSGDDKFKFKVTDDKGAESDTAEVKISIKSIIQPKQGLVDETNQGLVDETNQGLVDETNQGLVDETNQGLVDETNQGLVDETNQGVDNQTSIADGQNNSVNTENQSPIAYDQSLTVDANNKIDVALVGDDADNDTIQFAIVSNPSDASLDNFDMAKGTVTYTPHLDYVGNDSFAFKVIDDKAVESNIATVNVAVKENNQTNQAPQAFNQSTNESNLSDYRYLTWSAGEDEDRYVLFARSTDGGKTYSSPVSLSGNIHSDVFNPAVASSGNDVYVVWQGLSKNGNQDIFLRKSTDYGSSFGKAENISNDPGGSGNPEVEIVGNSTHVAWEGTTPGNNFIFYTTSDDGSGYDSPQKLSSNIGISYKPEIIVKDSPSSDSFNYKVTDEKGAQSNVATVDVNIDTIDQSKLEDDAKSVSVDSNQEIDITLKAKDKDNDTLQYEIVTPPSDGTLDNFDPNSGTVTYVPDNDNEVDISWHNYNNGRDRTMTKIVDNGDGDGTSSAGIENNDPFKAKR